MVQRLDGLRLDSVIRGDDQDRDVGHLGTTRTHGRECLVTRCVDDRQRAVAVRGVRHGLVRADVLGDAPGFGADHVGLADRVEQFGLTVIDVTHHGHHRRPRLEIAGLALVFSEFEVEGLQEFAVFVLGRDDLHVEIQLGAQQHQGVIVDRLRRGDHLSETDEDLDQISW